MGLVRFVLLGFGSYLILVLFPLPQGIAIVMAFSGLALYVGSK